MFKAFLYKKNFKKVIIDNDKGNSGPKAMSLFWSGKTDSHIKIRAKICEQISKQLKEAISKAKGTIDEKSDEWIKKRQDIVSAMEKDG